MGKMAESNRKKNIGKLGIFVVLLAVLVVVTKATGLDALLDKERLHAWIMGYHGGPCCISFSIP